MKPYWLIQTNTDGIDVAQMIAEVTIQGMVVRTIEHHPGTNIDFSGYSPSDCAICYGSIDFVRQVNMRAPFIPGVWCNLNNMKCSTYYTYLGKYMLNREYAMMPIGELLRRWEDLISTVPSKSLFVKPDSGTKSFTGCVFAPDGKQKIQTLSTTVGPETLVVVSLEKKITEEFRFVICDKKVIAGCRYLPTETSSYSTPSLRLALKISEQDWQPDLCYTIDIAESGGEMYLLEINSFSCAGFYDCNIIDVVRFASMAATKEWKEYN